MVALHDRSLDGPASLAPPDTGSGRDFDAIGATSDEISAFALRGLTRRLDVIGVPLSSP
jgi:hypothetical protein